MQPIRMALCCVLLATTALGSAEAQRGGGGRGSPLRPSATVPAFENYSPMAIGTLEVLSVRPADRVIQLRDKDGKVADVHVQDHVYDLSKLKPGDKVKVDFYQPVEGDTELRAAGIWPAE